MIFIFVMRSTRGPYLTLFSTTKKAHHTMCYAALRQRGWTLCASCFFDRPQRYRKNFAARETTVRKLLACGCLIRPTWSSSQPLFHQKSSIHKCVYYFLVEEGGFGPPKRNATDLQSAPFGHSGILPLIISTYLK